MPIERAQHVPVLVARVLEFLEPERGGVFVDCTLGLGGHAEALLGADEGVRLIGVDRDPRAREEAARRLAPFADRLSILGGRFEELRTLLDELGIERVRGVLADLGVSSMQLDTADRGFSFRAEGPLDMRMGPGPLTAREIVNHYSEAELERIFREYGEERLARRIARAVGREREESPIETTTELRDLVARVARRRHARIDPATRVFQALRIEVNEELRDLDRFLREAIDLLDAEGRLVVISYHSLEDRIVKNTFRDLARGEVDQITGRPRAETRLIEVLTRKPVRPDEREVEVNPRARSAKLRAARRLERSGSSLA